MEEQGRQQAEREGGRAHESLGPTRMMTPADALQNHASSEAAVQVLSSVPGVEVALQQQQ